MTYAEGWIKKATLSIAAALLLTSSILLPQASQAAASQAAAAKKLNITWNPAIYEFNGVKMQPTASEQGFVYNYSTYVPLRFAAYGLNQSVHWDQKTKTVSVSVPNAKEQVLITEYQKNAQYRALKGSSDQNVSSAKIDVEQITITYLFNGEQKQPKAELPGIAYKGRIYVPLRFVGESLGQIVKWDKSTNAIIMTSADHANNNNSNSNSGSANNPNIPVTPGDSGSAGSTVVPPTGKLTYAEITSKVESTLRVLEGDAQSQLYDLFGEYRQAATEAEKNRIMAEGQQVFDATTNKFNQLIADAEQKLKDNGYSTDVIQEYRTYYQKQVDLGHKIIESMQGNK